MIETLCSNYVETLIIKEYLSLDYNHNKKDSGRITFFTFPRTTIMPNSEDQQRRQREEIERKRRENEEIERRLREKEQQRREWENLIRQEREKGRRN